jgi:hypothetical protein
MLPLLTDPVVVVVVTEAAAAVLVLVVVVVIILVTMMRMMMMLVLVLVLLSLVTGLFFLVPLLKQRLSPPLRLQVSDYSTFRLMCDVPSIAAFCSELTECFPGMASKFFFKPIVNILVDPIITGIISHYLVVVTDLNHTSQHLCDGKPSPIPDCPCD